MSSLLFAQTWQMQKSGTTAGLRGVHAAGAGVVWASGTGGTLLRSIEGKWLPCSIPPDGEKLDFRGVWAWDRQTALALSSGPGTLSRLYSTEDSCRTWKLVLTNPDPGGFWDGILFLNRRDGFIYGDTGLLLVTRDGGVTWAKETLPAESFFAASNSSMATYDGTIWLGTGGARVLRRKPGAAWETIATPLASGNDSSGVFSVAFRDREHGVAVGGDYRKPDQTTDTAVYSSDGGSHWSAASQPPHGFRSAVAWNPTKRAWIAAGTNGCDASYDDGKTWQWLDSGNWNALSLPWVVGPNGRIGKAAAGVSR